MMEIGTIKAVHIYLHRQLYITAELELNLKGVNHTFGGPEIVLSGMQGGEPDGTPHLGRFLFRCMQICGVDSWDLLKSSKVLAEVRNGKVVAIADVSGNNWFNPSIEFEEMDQEREHAEPSFREGAKR